MKTWVKAFRQRALLVLSPTGWRRSRALASVVLGAAGFADLTRRDRIIGEMFESGYEYVGKGRRGDEQLSGSYLPSAD